MAFPIHLPSKLQLLDSCPKDPLMRLDKNFDDLRDCTSQKFKDAFMEAWKAIKNGRMRRLEDSVKEMKAHADATCPGAEKFLDVCYLQSAVAGSSQGKPRLYYMTLLAHAAVNKQKRMMKYLLDSGAKSCIGNGVSGTPLTQILVYASLFSCAEKIDIESVQLLSEMPFDIHVSNDNGCQSPIEMAISLKRLDIAKLLVKAGSHPIDPNVSMGYKVEGIVQLLKEYYEFGTNHYITWLLREYLLSDALPDFIETVGHLDILEEATVSTFADVGRHPAHAILMCGHEDMVRRLIVQYGSDLLTIKDNRGRSALQLAAQTGDFEAVETLIRIAEEFYQLEKSEMTAAILAASRRNHSDVVKYILLKDFSVMPKETEKLVDLTCAFQVLRDLNPHLLLKFPIAHYAARYGITPLFETAFPLISIGKQMFAALVQTDDDGKTPFETAIDNDQLCILRTLQKWVKNRESQTSVTNSGGKREWDRLWANAGPKWLLYACSHGSLDAVKFFIELGCSPNYESIPDGKTPLSCAAEAGKEETVAYLLAINDIKIPKQSKHSPILCASENGFARCVEMLLSKGANANDICPKSKYNSLMLAIEGRHSATALTILSDKNQGLEALQYRSGNYKTPMRMLIQHMPDLAEWVLNRIELDTSQEDSVHHDVAETILKLNFDLLLANSSATGSSPGFPGLPLLPKPESTQHNTNEKGCYYMEDKFELVDDFQSPKQYTTTSDTAFEEDHDVDLESWRPMYYDSSEHPLKLMVDFDRENLLSHPLVKELIDYKWKRIAIPGFLIYLGVYMIFLILLTSFALTLPIPVRVNENSNTSISTTSMTGPPTSDLIFLYFAAIICTVFDVIYLTIEVIQLARRGTKYLHEFENYVQVILNIVAFIFVFPLGHPDWVLPSWRWQIGAIAVFMGWLNCIILLKTMPYFGVNITMLFNIGYNFLTLIYLPVLLILTFGFPFYMLLAFDRSYFEGERIPGFLLVFTSPITTVWNTVVQTAGFIDSDGLYTESYFLYPELSSVIYAIFVFAIPILFGDFLIGVAVGETEEEREKANITIIKEKLDSFFEIEESIPPIRHIFFKKLKGSRGKKKLDEHMRQEFTARNKAIYQEIEEKRHSEDLKQSVRILTKQVSILKENLAKVRFTLHALQENVRREVSFFKASFKEHLAEIKLELKCN